jgi:hypothetical protein
VTFILIVMQCYFSVFCADGPDTPEILPDTPDTWSGVSGFIPGVSGLWLSTQVFLDLLP